MDPLIACKNPQLTLRLRRLELNERYLQKQLDYFTKQDARTAKNLVIVLSNLTEAMCHTYVKDPAAVKPMELQKSPDPDDTQKNANITA